MRPTIEPTERSTLRVMMTTAWPTATSSSSDGVSSRSRNPSEENRKFGFATVAATITSSSAPRMPVSRAVARWRTSRDAALEPGRTGGWTGAVVVLIG